MQMTMEDTIKDRLEQAFSPKALEIKNESDKHAGHRGTPDTGESHFNVFIVSEHFAGMGRVARHRVVYECLKDLLLQEHGIHALAIKAYTPEEKGM